MNRQNKKQRHNAIPRTTQQLDLEQKSETFFRQHLPQDWNVTFPNKDYGQDLNLEICEDGQYRGLDLIVNFSFLCKTKDNFMPKKTLTQTEQQIDLLQKLLIIELAKQGVSQNDIARIVGVASVKINSILKYFNSKKKK